MHTMKRKSSGFTLIELSIVIIILGILIIGSIRYTTFIDRNKIDGASAKLAADLRYAQSLAMSATTWHGISFEVNPTNTYSVYTSTGTLDAIIESPARFGTNFIVNTRQDYNTNITSANLSGGRKIEFSPLGVPYNDKLGSIMTVEGTIVLTSGSITKTIRITPNTGHVTIQ